MSQIDVQVSAAFKEGTEIKIGNTEVIKTDGKVQVVLHGNLIAERKGRRVWFSLAGHNTKVTRRRLNALGCAVCQRGGKPMLNGKEWWADKSYHMMPK